MGCRSDYLAANNKEIENSKVLALLKELKTDKLPKWFGNGHHEKVYNKTSKETLDKNVAKLCSKLQKVEDITKYSLEMQVWWRDHLKADKERVEKELKSIKNKEDKKKAIAKLTPHERELLGVK